MIDSDGGLHLKPVDQAKLGYLFLNEGVWQGKQIVSKEWVIETTKVHHHNIDMPDYAYQWWCGDFHTMNKTFFTYFASGHGGQKVLVFPEFGMVIVITQQVFNNPFGDLNFIAILSDYILPAVTGNSNNDEIISIPQNELAKFEGHYETENNEEFIEVVAGEGKLRLTSSNGQQNDFYPTSESIFKARILDLLNIHIEFITDAGNKIIAINSNVGFTNKQFISKP